MSEANPTVRPQRQPAIWVGLLLLGIVLLAAYARSFHGPFIFDDSSSIAENPTVKSWRTALFPPGDSGLTVSGRPIVNLSIAINWALGGDKVVGYHVMNFLIHLGSTLALFGIVRRALLLPMLREKYGSRAIYLATAVAAVWGLHPIQTESVTYIIQRAESLVGLFYLITAYFFIRCVEEPNRLLWRIACVIACMFGMGSKEVMVTAPVVLLMLDRTFITGSFAGAWKARRSLYLGLMTTWLLLAICIVSTGKRGSTVGFNQEVNAWKYAMTQGYAIIHYLKLFLWPNKLVLDYGGPLAEKLSDVAWRGSLLLLLLSGSVYLFFKKQRIGFFLVSFFVILAPTSSIVPVLTQTVAEHRVYLPTVPLVILLVIGSAGLFGGRMILLWCAAAMALGVRTYIRNLDYRTALTIWKSVTEDCAYNIRGWNSLSMTYSLAGDDEKAKGAMESALRIRPNDPEVFSAYANILSRLGKTAEAETFYRKAIKIDPNSYDGNYNLGVLMMEKGRTEESIPHFEIAIKVRPNENVAHYNLGKAYVAVKRIEDAVAEFEGIVKREPKASDARNNLGSALLDLNRPQEAVKVLQDGLTFAPQDHELHRTLGLAFMALGRTDEAIKQLKVAVQIEPNDAKAHADLGLALLGLGQSEEACAEFETALAVPDGLNKEMARALNVTAGDERQKMGQLDRAKTHYEQAVALNPDNPRLRYLLANFLLRTGAASESVSHYELIVAAEPSFAEAQGELGCAYMELGRLVEARVHLEYALRLQPENNLFRENLKRLGSLEKH